MDAGGTGDLQEEGRGGAGTWNRGLGCELYFRVSGDHCSLELGNSCD